MDVDDLVTAVPASLRLPAIEGRKFNLAMCSPPLGMNVLSASAKLWVIPISRLSTRRLKLETKLLAPTAELGV